MSETTNLPVNVADGALVNIQAFEEGLKSVLQTVGLPTEPIFVAVSERGKVFQNCRPVVELIPTDQRARSIYVSKFLAAVAAGLFDAALNYLWDETIKELRFRVEQYDLSYFYDNAGLSERKRADVRDASDLVKLDDSQLISGALKIELISEVGYKHLDFIRFMRNYASAAHPNQNELTGLQLVSWLETCIKEVISLPLSNVAVEIRKLLSNLKSSVITNEEAQQIGAFFLNLTQEQSNSLASGLFGIATEAESTPEIRKNVRLLIPKLWPRVDEETRQGFGLRYGRAVANHDESLKAAAHGFLEVCDALSYIPVELLVTEIADALEELIEAHQGWNNFYNEGTPARALEKWIPRADKVPNAVSKKFVRTLVEVFLSNSHGIATSANIVYERLIGQFSEAQAQQAILLIGDTRVSSKLQASLCKRQFLKLLDLVEGKVSSPVVLDLIKAIREFPAGKLDYVRSNAPTKKLIMEIEALSA